MMQVLEVLESTCSHLHGKILKHLKQFFIEETRFHLKISLLSSLEWNLQVTMHMSLAHSAALHYNIETQAA